MARKQINTATKSWGKIEYLEYGIRLARSQGATDYVCEIRYKGENPVIEFIEFYRDLSEKELLIIKRDELVSELAKVESELITFSEKQ